MIDTMAAEWLKLRSVRSTYILIGVVAAGAGAGLLLDWYGVRVWDGMAPDQRAHFALSDVAEVVAWVAQLCLALLGVLAVSGEYSSGMIRTTLTVVPRRATVLAAKASVVAAVALATGLAIPFLTYLLGRGIIGGRPIRGSSTATSDEVRLLLASGLLIAVFALVGLALAVVLRSAAGAIVTVVGLWYLLPIVALNLPAPWADRLTSVMLINLARELAGGKFEGATPLGLLSPAGAGITVLLYVALPLAAATYLIRRRDA